MIAANELDREFEEAFPPPEMPAVPTAPNAQYEDEYYPYEAAEQIGDDQSQLAPATISTGARIAYIVGALLVIFACVLFVYVLTTRIFPQQGVVSNARATETALASLRPAINTPIAVPPTVPSSGLLPATATTLEPPTQPPVEPPTEAPEPPTPTALVAVVPPTLPPAEPPTQAPQPPPPTNPSPQPVPPTAPPAQPQPAGGIIDAQMVLALAGGQPAGNVSAYNPTDPFVLAVRAQYGPGGVTSVRTRWYGPDGALLYELPREFSEQGTYYSGFTLRKSTPWQVGDYRVDIHTNNSPAPSYTVTFAVVP
jgi:hypothetical protein